jgi:phage FluMu protein Com
MESQSELIERKIQNTRRGALEFVKEALHDRLEPQFVTLVGGDHDGAKVVSLDGVKHAIAMAFATELPQHDVQSAEVVTPSIIFVDVRCPRCREVGRITATLTAELRVTSTDSELHIKAKASKVGHTCGQMTVLEAEAEPEDPETAAAIDAATEPADDVPDKPKRRRRTKTEPEETCPFPGCTFAVDHAGAHTPTMQEDLPPEVD